MFNVNATAYALDAMRKDEGCCMMYVIDCDVIHAKEKCRIDSARAMSNVALRRRTYTPHEYLQAKSRS